ncbi:hypothetical protein WAI453_001515 [Rhynchosporium graminicola]|uniref:Related to cytochrome P450 CYP3/CYP5/CYP6/CYP9 subfamilies n=1 Tax=Rhynchosporium graminicola TaxID=2792576 RepID=A0A1E1KC39_9HELO|nr:related to cytochrome P450 CYP3/CYP5/CYP6/CYP9 subfamilies [Rhynchosporium commune]
MISSWRMILLAFSSIALVLIGICIRNIFFHPLRHFPGPLLQRASRVFYLWYDLRGVSHWKVKEWHEKYGPVVRISPDELSYTYAEAWSAIYGFPHRDGTGNFEKDDRWWVKSIGGDDILTADEEGHRRMRRLQSAAFSDRALRLQGPVIEKYTSLLIHRLHGLASTDLPYSATVDINLWYNFTTFDLIGDLAFGEPFHCLRDMKWHWWLTAVFELFRVATFIRAARRFPTPIFYAILLLIVPKRLLKMREDQYKFGLARVNKRMQQEIDRPDFMSYILKVEDENGMTLQETYTAAQVFIAAGSETTASGLTNATYLLLENPHTFQKLKDEIRNSFSEEKFITISSTAHLRYLNAVIDETLRLAPPGPGAFPRKVPKGGRVVCGAFVPGGIAVGIHHLSIGRSPLHFYQPESFVPERWLGEAGIGFENDKKTATQAFSFGPRNCIGKNLALMEMRIIMCRLVWNFDMELHPDSRGWLSRQKMFTTWHKTDMKVRLKARKNMP